jgi:hypothetical protein
MKEDYRHSQTKAEGMYLHQTCSTRNAKGISSNCKKEMSVNEKKTPEGIKFTGKTNYTSSECSNSVRLTKYIFSMKEKQQQISLAPVVHAYNHS